MGKKELKTSSVFTKLVEQVSKGDQKEFSLLTKKPYTQVNDWCTGHRNLSLVSFLSIVGELRKKKIQINFNNLFKIEK